MKPLTSIILSGILTITSCSEQLTPREEENKRYFYSLSKEDQKRVEEYGKRIENFYNNFLSRIETLTDEEREKYKSQK
ncbi:MAG: hypothetical protein AABY22_09660 [Nanoarchaeota archaeon]